MANRSDIIKDSILATGYSRIDEGDCLDCQKVRVHEAVDRAAGCHGNPELVPECMDSRSDLHWRGLLFVQGIIC